MKFPIPHKVKTGVNEDYGFETREGTAPSIQINTKRTFTPEERLKIMKRLKHQISQQSLKAVDSTTPGDKYTHCNWGLCTDSADVYSEPAMHTFPYDFMNNGRVSPVEWLGRACPMNKNPESIQGCFYSCRIFKGPRPSKEEALNLVQISIENMEQTQ